MLVHILRLREGAEMNPFPMQREACRERVSEHLRVGNYTPEIGIDFRGCTGAEALMSAFREIDASTLPDDVRRASTWLRSTTKAGDLVVEEDGMTFVVAPGGFARLSYQFVELAVPVAVPAGDDVAIGREAPLKGMRSHVLSGACCNGSRPFSVSCDAGCRRDPALRGSADDVARAPSREPTNQISEKTVTISISAALPHIDLPEPIVLDRRTARAVAEAFGWDENVEFEIRGEEILARLDAAAATVDWALLNRIAALAKTARAKGRGLDWTPHYGETVGQALSVSQRPLDSIETAWTETSLRKVFAVIGVPAASAPDTPASGEIAPAELRAACERALQDAGLEFEIRRRIRYLVDIADYAAAKGVEVVWG